jgi:hypothetical protein
VRRGGQARTDPAARNTDLLRQRSEDAIERIRDAYRPFGDVEVPNDQGSPDATADRIAHLVTTKLSEGQHR